MWGKIIIPMYRLWLHGLYGLYGSQCPLPPPQKKKKKKKKKQTNLISPSLSHRRQSQTDGWKNTLWFWMDSLYFLRHRFWPQGGRSLLWMRITSKELATPIKFQLFRWSIWSILPTFNIAHVYWDYQNPLTCGIDELMWRFLNLSTGPQS